MGVRSPALSDLGKLVNRRHAEGDSRRMSEPPENPGMRTAAILSLCYSVPGTSLGERNGQHERTAWEAGFSGYPARFSGQYAVRFAVHFGIQTGSIG